MTIIVVEALDFRCFFFSMIVLIYKEIVNTFGLGETKLSMH